MSVKRLDVENFYFLAMFIANCRFFIGNQSMCAHIADGVFAPRILEICTQFPNTFPSNENGRPFINQGSLEYHFNRLLKETE